MTRIENSLGDGRAGTGVMPAALCGVSLLAICGLCASSIANAVYWVLPPLLCVAGWIARRRWKATFIGFCLCLWLMTPLLRRLIDLRIGWQELSLVMLTPALVSGLAVLDVAWARPKSERFICGFLLVFAGAVYAAAIGIWRNSAAPAIHGLIEWIVPPVLGVCVMGAARTRAEVGVAVRMVLIYGTAAMGIYGVVQFVNPPEWDRMWMRHVSMNSIGYPEPYRVRVFSTMNSPAPYATTAAAGLLLMCGAPMRRIWWAVVAGAAGLVLSLVRSAWGGMAVGLAVMGLLGAPVIRQRIASLILLGGLACVIVLATGEGVQRRFESLGSIQDDESYRARLGFHREIAWRALGDPVGGGLGSTGTSVKLSSGSFLDFDSGVLNIPFVLGWAGTLAYGGGVIWLVRGAFRGLRQASTTGICCIGVMCSSLFQLVFGNVLIGASGIVFWMALGLRLAEASVLEPRDAGNGTRE